jgi:hypothetical protein
VPQQAIAALSMTKHWELQLPTAGSWASQQLLRDANITDKDVYCCRKLLANHPTGNNSIS